MFTVETRDLGTYEVAVCGGGIAGVGAALAAAKNGARTVLIESGGCLGGTMTQSYMPNIMDYDNKGGLVRELMDFLNKHNMTCARRGPKADAAGKRIPGCIIDTEGAKYYFDEICREAGIKVLLYSRVAGVQMEGSAIQSVLLATECGNFTLSAKIWIDSTGSGAVADFAGCKWDCGDPFEHRPSPISTEVCAVGFPEDYNGTDTEADKTEYNRKLEENGIHISAQQACVVKLPSLKTWDMGFNFQYGVFPDEIEKLSEAALTGRKESFEVVEAHKKIPGLEEMWLLFTGDHVGIREGRRIYGQYRLSDDDIIEGRRFPDGVCLVTAGVDVHKLHDTDTTECARGYRTKPYHIPYGCLVPLGVSNLLLAGRCISGDFYPFSSYRMMGNMAATGEAAGYAAACCSCENKAPAEIDGTEVSAFMRQRGYAL